MIASGMSLKCSLLKPLSGIEAGKAVGKKEHDKIIGELDQLRQSEWR